MEPKCRIGISLAVSLGLHSILLLVLLGPWWQGREAPLIGTPGMVEVFVQTNESLERVALRKASRRQFLQPGPEDKIAEGRADILGRPKMDRVFSKSHPESDSFGDQTAEQETLLGQIRRQILAKKNYPFLARKNGEEGITTVSFLINPDGMAQNIRIQQSSGFTSLDTAAKALIAKAGPYPAYPEPITLTLRYTLTNR